MFHKRAAKVYRSDEENPFLLSFSDLMASLLAVFILALIVMMIQLHLKKLELERDREKIKVTLVELLGSLEEIEQTQDAIVNALSGISVREASLAAVLEGIQKDLKERGIAIIVAENGTVLRIPEQALHFQLGKYQIPDEFSNAANAIGTALLSALEDESNRALLDTVFIEGHTDAVPYSALMGNWGLSTYRAISLWNHWTEEPGACSGLANLRTIASSEAQNTKPLISVSGYGETRPTDRSERQVPETSPAGGALGVSADRRIDIRFTLATSEKTDLENLHSQMGQMRTKTRALIEKLRASE